MSATEANADETRKRRRIRVLHGYYGCDTGCCGHYIEIDDDDAHERHERFDFAHPHGEDHLEWAKQFVREQFGEEHVRDLDWENCEIYDD